MYIYICVYAPKCSKHAHTHTQLTLLPAEATKRGEIPCSWVISVGIFFLTWMLENELRCSRRAGRIKQTNKQTNLAEPFLKPQLKGLKTEIFVM